MKKILFTLLAAIVTVSAWADSKLVEGSLINLKNPSARVLVKWDYSNMLIEDQKPEDFLKSKGADWERDYPAEVTAGESAFDVEFNKKDKKFALITDDEDDAQYEMVIHVDAFHYGSLGAAIAFGGFARGAHIEGTVDVIDRESKETIAVLSYNCAGAASYSNESRRILAYMDLAKDLAKQIKKAK